MHQLSNMTQHHSCTKWFRNQDENATQGSLKMYDEVQAGHQLELSGTKGLRIQPLDQRPTCSHHWASTDGALSASRLLPLIRLRQQAMHEMQPGAQRTESWKLWFEEAQSSLRYLDPQS